ncbi:uncharacterized protein [Choristoneura fumiferana]|uniref:uncharacterized protein n=1 Tax=Choristoneura fumiferana TaxID=7141 RepID=UPI003D15E06E
MGKRKSKSLVRQGSQRSYIKEEVAVKLGIPVAGEEELSHALFGGVTVQSKQQREEEVIANFEENIHVNEQGRYEVCLPWKAGHDDLLSNQELSIRRLESTTKKLITCGKFHNYNEILAEWEQAGIIEEVPEAERDTERAHYLPHRAVTKEASLTTKLRPVYDASAKDKKVNH